MDPQATQNAPGLITFVPFLLFSIPAAAVAFALSRQKGRNVVLWTLLGIIPMVNIFTTWFLVGATNLILDEKIDRILKRIENEQR